MDKTPHSSAAYAPLKEEPENAFPQQLSPYPPAPEESNQAFASQPQPQPQPQYNNQPQAYPPQGYTPQQGYASGSYVQAPQGYPPQLQQYPPAPQQGYVSQPYPAAPQTYVVDQQQPAVMQMQSGYPTVAVAQPQVVYSIPSDPYVEVVPFIPTNEPFSTQLSRLPKTMWTAITGPKMTNFNQIKMGASWGIVWFLLAIKVIGLLCLQLIAMSIIQSELEAAGVPAETYQTLGFVAWYTILSVPLGYFIVNGFFHGFASCIAGHRPELTGHPTFMQYCYSSLLIGLPLDFVSAFVGLIPAIGSFLVLVIWIYQLVLWVCALKGVYHMTTGQAIGVIVLFAVVVMVLALILIFTVGMAFFAVVAGAN